ncbi:MAG TPA: hypothetical protein VKK79_12285, partial [Candidatus Lokiarchaeia archaeon]|nr:hypothetical protein [Candidatus Lokiarchaeia archaeon]
RSESHIRNSDIEGFAFRGELIVIKDLLQLLSVDTPQMLVATCKEFAKLHRSLTRWPKCNANLLGTVIIYRASWNISLHFSPQMYKNTLFELGQTITEFRTVSRFFDEEVPQPRNQVVLLSSVRHIAASLHFSREVRKRCLSLAKAGILPLRMHAKIAVVAAAIVLIVTRECLGHKISLELISSAANASPGAVMWALYSAKETAGEEQDVW